MDVDRPFPFLELPPELRFLIYHYVFALLPYPLEYICNIKDLQPSALMQVCRYLRQEVTAEFLKYLQLQEAKLLNSSAQAGTRLHKIVAEKQPLSDRYSKSPHPDAELSRILDELEQRRWRTAREKSKANEQLVFIRILKERCHRQARGATGYGPTALIMEIDFQWLDICEVEVHVTVKSEEDVITAVWLQKMPPKEREAWEVDSEAEDSS